MDNLKTHYPPATDHEIAAYRRGIETGVMRCATPNVVGSLIARIEQETGQAIEAQPELPPADPGHLAGVGMAEKRRREIGQS